MVTRKAWKKLFSWKLFQKHKDLNQHNHTLQVRSNYPCFTDRQTTCLKLWCIFEAVDKWLPDAILNITHSWKRWPHFPVHHPCKKMTLRRINLLTQLTVQVTVDTSKGDGHREHLSSQQLNQAKPNWDDNLFSNPSNFKVESNGVTSCFFSALLDVAILPQIRQFPPYLSF